MAPYFLRNLVPRREQRQGGQPLLTVLRHLTWIQWAHCFAGWLAWTCDAIDFFSVSLAVTPLATQFGKSTATITTSITLTLLFRSAGAAIFGILSDRFGRKWPLVFNLILCCILELGSGFVQTYKQFLAVRSLYGIVMGGVWGLAASTALENLPVEARGLASGVVQQGYAVGYLLAAVINLTLVADTKQGWRTLFWTAAGLSLFAAAVRAVLPESEVFLRAKAIEKARGTNTSKKTKIFIRETKEMLKRHWLLCIYAVLLMTGFNFLSHGSQDLYPTYMEKDKGFSTHDATIATIIGNCGAIAGGCIAGWLSQYIGRRLTIVLCVILVAAFIPLWILPSSFSALSAGAFCIQFGVQGAWGVIPIQLAEMSPPAFRAFFPGVAYQLGNMVSSASAQIEATGGNNIKTILYVDGQPTVVPNYAKVQGIFIGVVSAFVIIITIIGPENHGSHFEKHKTAFEEGGGRDEEAEEVANSPVDSVHDEKRSIRETA
ncbi:carboxylic acid transporter protein [Serpula lacrymans var. lacrymans S7.9]|uniref:Carboxylic acid transporter protein n=1 Tax=Serpula lacrymans var. lacrymans (strain S7.9) TaxID=578457 RepID=F8PC31_SERL9|nr:carboxylic acid transporter protein [Serpula lacrymans var. lacrymans S7.9]EGO19231.1 carboxylic acid transporter protein [Serpula lacrymans var. lacrymans S7.9]